MSLAMVTDHPFEPSYCYPDGKGCAHIVEGGQWTMADPNRCRRSEGEHEAKRQHELDREEE